MTWKIIVLLILAGASWGCKGDLAAARRRAEQVKRTIGPLMEQARVRADPKLFARAARMLEGAIKDAPQDASLHVKLAVLLKERWYTLAHARTARQYDPGAGQPPARVGALLQRALSLDPRDRDAHRAMADYSNATGRPADAVKHYRKLLELRPANLAVHVDIGTSYLFAKQPDRARAHFQEVLTSGRALDVRLRQRALDGMANAALQQGKVKDAEGYFLQAVQPGPLACSYHSLGQLYAGLGKFRQGARYVMKVAELEPARADIQLRAAVFAFLAHDFVSARRYGQRTLKASPGSLEASTLLGYLLLLERKYAAARKTFDAGQRKRPRHAGASVGLGHLAIIRKDYGRARRLLSPHAATPEKELDRRTFAYLAHRMARLGLGWMHANQGRHARALAQFEALLAIDAADLFALLGRGSALTALGKLDRAAAAFKAVLELDPGNQYALAELGLVKLNRGDTAGAEQAFRKAMARGDRRYTCPHEGLGLVYLRQGKIARARKSFERAIAINPDIEYKKFNELAKILIKQGEKGRAIKLLERSVANYPHDPEARLLLERLKAAP